MMMISIKDTQAYKYAEWCVKETDRKVPSYVKKQCKLWLDICNGEDENGYIDQKKLDKVIKLLKVINHPVTRKPMYESLEDYQWLLLLSNLCTKWEDGTNYYQNTLLEISRKQYKTLTVGLLYVLHLLLSKQFSRLYSVAPTYKLSCELKEAVDKIIKCNPCLKKHFKINNDITVFKAKENRYYPLAYNGTDALDGFEATVG